MSYEMKNEELKEIYLPGSLRQDRDNFLSISKLKESLVVLEKNHASNANVWIMQNGEPNTFTYIHH